ncbi:hypothetical protein EDB89DRAFT_1884149 [Lactarius sanguifluus]|nr:hypothetical protein EDB89DRAFT_1884149 [Lactarius sanguifluus]
MRRDASRADHRTYPGPSSFHGDHHSRHPSSRADPEPVQVESSNVLFDDPEADVVLRSRDSQTFRVLKLYITRSSTVLSDLILAAFDSFRVANVISNEGRLLEVQLSDSSAILSSLLTFIFPVLPILPSTLEETMELLSVAQKYEMNSILTHIRGSLALQDPPFIRQENAFLAYSVAQRYGLRKEAIQAARLTLKFTLTIERPELEVVPGAYLHELWNYHKTVRAQFSHHSWSRAATVFNATLNDLNCTRSNWAEAYVVSIRKNPSLFDPIEFQMALTRHTTKTVDSSGFSVAGCPRCTNIPVETIRAFWTALAATFRRCTEMADSELLILGTEKNSQSHIGLSVTHLPLPECLDTGEADIIVRTSDLANFLIHKSVLASSSPVFRDMFALPNPSNDGMIDGLPVVDISEDSELVRSLITIMYPVPSEIPASYDKVLALLAAAQKYEMDAVQSTIRAEVARGPSLTLDGAEVFRAYAIASSSGLKPEMEMAARLTLDQPMTFKHLGTELRSFEGRALRELVSFREQCRDNLVSCFKSILNTDHGPSKIWVGCPADKIERLDSIGENRRKVKRVTNSSGSTGNDESEETATALPSWLHNLFTREIEELKQAFKRPLIEPSTIREKYLEALQDHSSPDLCTFCARVHVTKGEWYCVRLEKALNHARAKASTVFSP